VLSFSTLVRYLTNMRQRAGAVAQFAACFSATLLPASAATLQITSPADGAVVHSGKSVLVMVNADSSVFQCVGLVGDSPLGDAGERLAPPYRFTLQVEPGLPSGLYTITAIGLTQSGDAVFSAPITIDIERSDSPKQHYRRYQALNSGTWVKSIPW
jgi:hypothetical protein